MQQLPMQMPTYTEKKHYHVSKKFTDVSSVWHPDTLFQPNDILVGTSLLSKIPLSTFISKTIHRKSIPSSNHVKFIYISSFLHI